MIRLIELQGKYNMKRTKERMKANETSLYLHNGYDV